MKNKTITSFVILTVMLSIVALSLAVFKLGAATSREHYKSQITKLEKQIEQLQTRKTTVIYQVDNNGATLVGTVTDKTVVDGHYTVTIGAYGKFLVTKEQFDSINIGDDAPEHLKQRGIDSNKTPLELEGQKDE